MPEGTQASYTVSLIKGERMPPKIAVVHSNLAAIGFVIAFRAGSVYETPKTNGLFHLCEHLLLEGGEKKSRLILGVEEIGGIVNGLTVKDCVALYAKIPKLNFQRAIGVLADGLKALLPRNINENQLGAVKRVIQHEIKLRSADPLRKVIDTWWKTAYAQDSLSLPPVGSISSLSRITKADVERAFQSHFTQANAMVVWVGDVRPKGVIKKFSETLTDYPEGNAVFPTYSGNFESSPKVSVIDAKSDQVHMVFGFVGFRIDDPEADTLRLLGALVGGRRGSKLFQRLRIQSGLSYCVNTFIEGYCNGGTFIIHTTCEPGQVLLVTQIVAKTLREVKEGRVTDEEVNRARTYLKGKIALERDDALTQAITLARCGLYQDNADLDHLLSEARWDSITKDDIVRTAGRILKPSRLSIVLAGQVPEKMAEDSLALAREDLTGGG